MTRKAFSYLISGRDQSGSDGRLGRKPNAVSASSQLG